MAAAGAAADASGGTVEGVVVSAGLPRGQQGGMSGIHTVPSSDGIGVGGWWRTFKERNRQFLIRTKMFGEMGAHEDLKPTEATRADRM